jgi:hypothetical protein
LYREQTALYKLALDSADVREIAEAALVTGMQLAFGKTRKGTAVLKLQELREKLDAL